MKSLILHVTLRKPHRASWRISTCVCRYNELNSWNFLLRCLLWAFMVGAIVTMAKAKVVPCSLYALTWICELFTAGLHPSRLDQWGGTLFAAHICLAMLLSLGAERLTSISVLTVTSWWEEEPGHTTAIHGHTLVGNWLRWTLLGTRGCHFFSKWSPPKFLSSLWFLSLVPSGWLQPQHVALLTEPTTTQLTGVTELTGAGAKSCEHIMGLNINVGPHA